MSTIKYTVLDDFDHIVDEKANTFIAVRKLVWGEVDADNVDKNKIRFDIRKWYTRSDGTESVGKGVSFITEQGPHNLAKMLVENNYGDTKDLLVGLKDRDNFRSSLNSILDKDDDLYDEDAGNEEDDLYVPDDDLFDYDEE